MLRRRTGNGTGGASCLCLRSSLRARGDHLGGSPSNSQVQGRVTRSQAQTEEDALKLHLEECLCLAHEACGIVSWVGVATWARAWQLEVQSMAEEWAVVWGRQRRPCLCVWLVKKSHIWVG